ncbi:ATP-binding protein [Kitasatospora sp. NPDC004723]|uniref:ATP-binding protein n=1 Tax=Kitasatospora sp. NPDC004723 TaxID=3154288 RepID=UPI00339DE3B0
MRSLAEGDTDSRDLKAVIEEVLALEYKGRVIVELLQNAHDAHPAKAGVGRVEILLDETEGEHGVLYVANGGREVTRERFDALRRVAASPKRPDEGIGHKGVGFKSVRQLTEAPEVYSVSRPGAKAFDGYGFRFAWPSDFDRLAAEAAPDDPSAADKLRENLSALMLPVPVDEVPEPVRQLCRRGIVTVVRLPLKDTEARDSAAGQLRELTDDSAPFELFLDCLATVVVSHTQAGAAPKRVVFGWRVTTLYKGRGLRIEEVALRRGRLKLVLVRSRVPEERVLPALPGALQGPRPTQVRPHGRRGNEMDRFPTAHAGPVGRQADKMIRDSTGSRRPSAPACSAPYSPSSRSSRPRRPRSSNSCLSGNTYVRPSAVITEWNE